MTTETTTEIILSIEAKGEIVSSNFPAFAEMVRARLGEINRNLSTDEDFDQADSDAKAIAGAEASLKSAKEKALADAEQLYALFEGIDGLSAELAAARLDLAGQIKRRKEEIKSEIVEEFLGKFDIDPKTARKHFLAGLQSNIKGKRTLESMRTACRIYQTTQQAMIVQCRAILASFEKAHGQDLISDRRELELEKPDGLEAELRRRFEAKRAREEKAKLEAEAATAKAEAAKAQAALAEANKPPVDPRNPHNLPLPPKIGSIPTGSKAEVPESNVVPFALEASPETITEADEWKQVEATVYAAFALIKEHRERLIHPRNLNRLMAFGPLMNHAWKEIKNIGTEVAS